MSRPNSKCVAVATAFLPLIVCGSCGLFGGGGGSSGGSASANLSAKSTFTDDDIRHFLIRTHFGIKQSDFDQVKAQGLSAYVDAMLNFPAIGSTAAEQAADALLVNGGDPPGLEGGFPSEGDLAQWWIYLMVNNPNPFQEALAFFWHEHFATSTSVLGNSERYWYKNHINLFREKGVGNLRNLVVSVSRDWAMLKWLDGVISTKGNPNENYARELWELFTLGVDNGYTYADIVGSAEALAGYEVKFNSTTGQSYVQFNPDKQSNANKTFFGLILVAQPGSDDDYQAVVDMTVDNRPVAEFISKKILRHFCMTDPPQSLITGLADVLENNNYELKPVFKTLFKSNAFYSEAAKAGLIRGAVHNAIGFIRTTGLKYEIDQIDSALQQMGQRPTQPPNVNGWPEGALGLSAQRVVDHANFFNTCITKRTYQASNGIKVADMLPANTPKLSENVVDEAAALLGVQLTDAERAECITFLDTKKLSGGATAPSLFTWEPINDPDKHIDERFRNLLWILALHPTYFVR